ncbi:MAG: GAF domain-containing sensor histidine kinase [Clostridiaceae bacterium]|nr:GAF domain-containing sensor histidine kinase [Clostridiaceae bacterium]
MNFGLESEKHKGMENQLEQRSKLLTTLLDVSNLISSIVEIRPLMESILDRLKTIIDYHGAKIFLVEGEFVKLLAHRSSLSKAEEENCNLTYRNNIIGTDIIIRKKTVIINDIYDNTSLSQELRKFISNYLDTVLKDSRSWMGIPLIIKNKVIGVLTIDHTQAGYYTLQDAEYGLAFANQAAIEFENISLYKETVKRADEMKTMLSIQQAITSRLNLEDVLKLIADEARRLTKAISTMVFLVDGDELVISAFSGKYSIKIPDYRIPIDKHLFDDNFAAGSFDMFDNYPVNPDTYSQITGNNGEKTYLNVPLTAGSRLVGVISVINRINHEFSTDDEHILNMLASSAVIGVENARMYEEEQRLHEVDHNRRIVAEGLRDILAVLNSNRPLNEILSFIVCEAARLMNTDAGSLYQLSKEDAVLELRASCGLPKELLELKTVPLNSGAIGETILKRKPVAIYNIPELYDRLISSDELSLQQKLLYSNFNGLLAVPLICKDEVYGSIVLYFKKSTKSPGLQRNFTDEQISLAATFADQAALAIDNARLRTQAEKMAVAAERNRLARDLHDSVTQTLFSSSLIAEVLPKIWEKNQTEGMKRLEELKQLTRGALAEMRTLLLELRPATLVEASLEELFRQLTEAMTGRARIPISVNIDNCNNIPVDLKIVLYRITQEALNNISKHSGASKVSVCLVTSCDELSGNTRYELSISDDGRGFDPNQVTGEHLGIGIMRERCEAIGAEFLIESTPGKGSNITVVWQGKCS